MATQDYFAHGIGFLAAAATVWAFYSRDIRCLRAAAIVANMMFIVYGALLMLFPVLALHLILLPLNIARLASASTLRNVNAARPTAQISSET